MAEAIIHGVKIEVVADIRITAEEAEVLKHITDFGYLKEFHQRCSTQFTVEKMTKVVADLRGTLNRITSAYQKAKLAMTEAKVVV